MRRSNVVWDAFAKDLEKAGLFSLPITLAILVVAFGALVAAGIPLLLAFTAVLATMGLLALPSQFVPLDESVGAIVLLIGLAVGVDYAMFYVKRAREERAAGRSESAALEAAAATSGRAVLISGLTVMVAMAGMFLTGEKTLTGFAIATILVVAAAVAGSLTVLPALLSWLGDRVEKARVPPLRLVRAARRRDVGRRGRHSTRDGGVPPSAPLKRAPYPRAWPPFRRASSSTVRSAVGSTSRRSSGIASPLSTERSPTYRPTPSASDPPRPCR